MAAMIRILNLCLISALAACSGEMNSAKTNADPDAAISEKLPLAKKIVWVKEAGQNGEKTTRHLAAFGNWAAECSYSRGGAGEETAWCDVVAFNGEAPRRKTVMVPYEGRATVQFYNDKPAKVALWTKPRAAGTELGITCGYAQWRGPENSSRIKFFYDDDAHYFISHMKDNGCTITYTPRGETAPVEIQRISHGFKQAAEYGEQFSNYPKAQP